MPGEDEYVMSPKSSNYYHDGSILNNLKSGKREQQRLVLSYELLIKDAHRVRLFDFASRENRYIHTYFPTNICHIGEKCKKFYRNLAFFDKMFYNI